MAYRAAQSPYFYSLFGVLELRTEPPKYHTPLSNYPPFRSRKPFVDGFASPYRNTHCGNVRTIERVCRIVMSLCWMIDSRTGAKRAVRLTFDVRDHEA